MPLITTETIVLQSYAYSETSKILRLLTRTHGVRSVIAKGALRPRSQYGGILEAFSVGTASIYLRDGRDLHTLGGFDLIRTGQALGRDLARFGTASLVTELVLHTASEEADPALYEQLRGALERIEHAAGGELEAVGLTESWTMLARLGFAPLVDDCIACARALEAAEECIFDYAAGGPLCADCASGRGGRALPAHARRALASFVRGEVVIPERVAAHWALLSRFLAYHLADGGTLRSLRFLTEILGRE